MKLTMNDSDTFKILQFTDLHLRDLPFSDEDRQTFHLIEQMIARHQPGLIIFTGDMVWGTVARQADQIFEAFLDFCHHLPVPVALTYGNHDTNQPEVSRKLFHELAQRLTNHVPKNQLLTVNERENYTIEIYDRQDQLCHVLAVLDSGEYSTSAISRYDWILPEQITWYQTMSAYYQQQSTQQIVAFQHIPLIEFYEAYQKNKPFNGGVGPVRVDSPSINTGFFATLLFDPLTQGLFVGHNHNNNFQTNYHGLEMIFGQVSGYGANAELQRGARFIELSEQGFYTERVYL